VYAGRRFDPSVSTLVIVNPAAGKGRAVNVWQRVRAELSSLETWECVYSQHAGHARKLAASATARGYEKVVALGGDGTVYEVANGLAGTETALGIIPVGTGNDTAGNLGIPFNALDAARLAAQGSARAIDLGEIRTAQSTSYFVNVAGFGFDAEVAWRVVGMPWRKLVGGTVPYVAGVLQTLWRYRSPGMRISVDQQAIERRVFLVAVANNPSYGGGMRIAPNARHDDGLFDVCVVSDLSRLEVLRLVPKLYSGSHAGHPAVELFRCCEVSAQADRRVRCQADGELVGDLPASFRIVPGALRCITGPS
jgi:YegS/Rv2252/BmrU family lipid kinase